MSFVGDILEAIINGHFSFLKRAGIIGYRDEVTGVFFGQLTDEIYDKRSKTGENRKITEEIFLLNGKGKVLTKVGHTKSRETVMEAMGRLENENYDDYQEWLSRDVEYVIIKKRHYGEPQGSELNILIYLSPFSP